MTSRLLAVALMAIAMGFSHPGVSWPQEKVGFWLDELKPESWNQPGAAIPVAPKVQGAADPRCGEEARPPQLDEDKSVHQQGWELAGAYQGGWDLLVIRGTAGYDGMCRPRQYQDFVFVHGVFAGTLSPQLMDSRTDGALERVSIQSAARLTAEYVRYSAKDALCCPSRVARVVFDVATDGVLHPASTSTTKR